MFELICLTYALHVLQCEYCIWAHCDIDAKTIYCAVLLQTDSPLAAEFYFLFIKELSDLQLVHLRLLTWVAHLVCRRVSSVHYLVNHFLFSPKCCYCAVTFWTLSRAFMRHRHRVPVIAKSNQAERVVRTHTGSFSHMPTRESWSKDHHDSDLGDYSLLYFLLFYLAMCSISMF